MKTTNQPSGQLQTHPEPDMVINLLIEDFLREVGHCHTQEFDRAFWKALSIYLGVVPVLSIEAQKEILDVVKEYREAHGPAQGAVLMRLGTVLMGHVQASKLWFQFTPIAYQDGSEWEDLPPDAQNALIQDLELPPVEEVEALENGDQEPQEDQVVADE